MVMACEWMVKRRAILRGEKRSEQTRVKQPDSLLNFDMAIYSGEHNRERGEKMYGRQKTPLLLHHLLLLQAIAKKQQQSRGRTVKEQECPTADNNNKIDSFVVTGYLSIPPIFETIPRTLALFVSVILSLVKRVVEERNSFLAVKTSERNAV